jgi:hypothetical protein
MKLTEIEEESCGACRSTENGVLRVKGDVQLLVMRMYGGAKEAIIFVLHV